MDAPYPSQGCRNAHYVDKSRPYTLWTLADLFTDVIQNFLHFEKVNKSQTRIFNMHSLFYAAELSEPVLRHGRDGVLLYMCKNNLRACAHE